jgi:hypothetical protein
MSEEMQQDAVDCATQALEKYNIEKVSKKSWTIKYFKYLNQWDWSRYCAQWFEISFLLGYCCIHQKRIWQKV